MQELAGVGIGEMDEAIARDHVGLDWTSVVKFHGSFDQPDGLVHPADKSFGEWTIHCELFEAFFPKDIPIAVGAALTCPRTHHL